jgi:hypothetical protein
MAVAENSYSASKQAVPLSIVSFEHEPVFSHTADNARLLQVLDHFNDF